MNSAPKERIVSHAPTVSSIYSRAPSDWKDPNIGAQVSTASYYGDVSPPESPRHAAVKAHGSGDVSPIEPASDIHPAFRVQKSAGTHIPVLRKVTPNTASPPRSSTETRWDKYSGEPTQGPTGLASQVKPGSALPIMASRKGVEAKSNIPALDKSRLRSVTERAANLTKGLAIDTRPAWKGASGRTTLVAPVADKPDRTMPQPQRDTKKQSALPSPPPSTSPTHARRGIPHEAETEYAPIRQGRSPVHETVRPVSPTKSGQKDSHVGIKSTDLSSYGPDSYPSPVSINDQPTESHHQPVKPPNAPVGRMQDDRGDTPPPNSTKATPPKSRPSIEYSPAQQPDSRFSWTTQATNTTYQRSPPPSPPPMPAAFATGKSIPAPTEGGLVMSRTRPIPSSRNEPPASAIITTAFRKPVAKSPRSDADGPPRSTFPLRASSRALSMSSTTTINGGPKALPPTPQEVNSQDHIGALQAQIEDLSTQRSNVQRVLRDLLKPEATNPLVTSFRAEREREKRVQGLKDELNEIALLEHDVGLKLHRAYKKREKEEGSEGTALWIKRIAS